METKSEGKCIICMHRSRLFQRECPTGHCLTECIKKKKKKKCKMLARFGYLLFFYVCTKISDFTSLLFFQEKKDTEVMDRNFDFMIGKAWQKFLSRILLLRQKFVSLFLIPRPRVNGKYSKQTIVKFIPRGP